MVGKFHSIFWVFVSTNTQNICLDGSTIRIDNSKHYSKNGVTPVTVFFQSDSDTIIAFNQTTGDFITGDRQRAKAVDKFKTQNIIGGDQWIEKWSK